MKLISDEQLAIIERNTLAAMEALEDVMGEFSALAARYDEAMKRIDDLTAELEYLRREVNRG